jgi:hypothetical protein
MARSRAFSSEVESGSREENASKQGRNLSLRLQTVPVRRPDAQAARQNGLPPRSVAATARGEWPACARAGMPPMARRCFLL